MRASLRRIWALLRKDVAWAIRDWEFLLLTVGPLLIVLGINFGGDLFGEGPQPKGAIVDASGEFTAYLKTATPFEWHSVDSVTDAEAQLKAQSVNVVLIVPPGFADAARQQTGEPPQLEMVMDSRSIGRGAAASGAVRQAIERFANPRIPAVVATRTLQSGFSGKSVLRHMILVIEALFIGVFFLPLSLGEEKESGVLEALALSPATVGEIMAAKVIFGVLGTVLASMIIVVGTGGLNAALGWLLLYLVAGGACFVSLGLAISLVTKTRKSGEMAATLALLVLSQPVFLKDALGGAEAIAAVLPSDWFATGLHDVFGDTVAPGAALMKIGGLLAVAALAFAASAWSLRAKDR